MKTYTFKILQEKYPEINEYFYSLNPVSKFIVFKLAFCFVIFWNQSNAQGWYSGNWYARKQITIDYTKVGSTGAPHSNYPFLVSINDNDLLNYARSDGFDILFTSSDGTTKLDYDRESYASGSLVAWVKIPSLSASANTVIYMYYGYSSSSDQQSMNATWNSNYKAVWHLKETSNGTTSEFVESTSNNKHGTGQPGAGYSTQINAKIGKGQDFANDRISIASPSFGLSSTATFSFWQNGDAAVQPASHFLFYGDDASTYRVASISCPYSDGTVYYDCGNNASSYNRINKAASSSEYEGQWNYWVCTKDANSGDMKLYLNGSLWHSGSSLTYSLSTFNKFDIGGAWIGGLYDGSIDEFRISNIAQGAGWILTDYNNQNSPSTFYSLGSQVLPIELLYFKSKIENNTSLLTWATASEKDNDYFIIEKSIDGKCFEPIARIEGAGTSQQILKYSFIDVNLIKGTVYYRLKQIDYDGAFSYSNINAVSCCNSALTKPTFTLQPNPASSHLSIETFSPEMINAHYSIFDNLGNQLINKELILIDGYTEAQLDISELNNGIYFMAIFGNDLLLKKKFTVSK